MATVTYDINSVGEVDFCQVEKHDLQIDLEHIPVLKIQRTCVFDGPGIRTTIFFRQCGLRCLWCQNPESLSAATPCRDARARSGMSLARVVEEAARDADYYRATGGGVTLSGGEPLLQPELVLETLVSELHQRDIQVAVETSLHVPRSRLERLAGLIDLFLVDLKSAGDDEEHKKLTGQSAGLLRSNIDFLVRTNVPIRFRMVIVPGFNDSAENLQNTVRLLNGWGHSTIELLKYHNMYEDKAAKLGLTVNRLDISPQAAVEALVRAAEFFRGRGVTVLCDELEGRPPRSVFSNRVYNIQRAIRESPYHLCFEVSKLKTKFYEKNGFDEPSITHRAKRLKYVLENKKAIIWPEELLVGTFTAKRKGGQVWEEHCGALMAILMPGIHKQQPVPFLCSWADRLEFVTRIAPFWAKHGLMAKVYKDVPSFVEAFARFSDLSTGFNNNMASIAHFVVNYERILTKGTTGLIAEVKARKQSSPADAWAFYDSLVCALEGLETFADRYAQHASACAAEETDPARKAELLEIASICRKVPRLPASTFREALQSMLFLHIALCLESFENAVSPGRLDQVLWPYYSADIEANRIDYDQAKELLALFILKMDECILVNDGSTYTRVSRLFETMSTDQTVTAGGVDPDGKDATNDLTFMLLDICELQPYSVNMAARIHDGSTREYLERLAEVYINGSPMPALYNDRVYLNTLLKHYNATERQARNYSIIGCVEPNASDDHYGNTDCANINVALAFLQALRGDERDLWNLDKADQAERIATKAVNYHFSDGRVVNALASAYQKVRGIYTRARTPRCCPPATMEELLDRFQERLDCLATAILTDHQQIERAISKDFPTPLASVLFPGAVERGLDVNSGGASINSSGIQAVGITDVADSLLALDEVVFKKRLFSIDEVIAALDNNFQGPKGAAVRAELQAVPKFGQDEVPEAAMWVNRTLAIYVRALGQVPGVPRNGIYSAGYYALNVSDVYGKKTPALPSGRMAGVPLANSITPHYGMPANDLLSALNSVASVDFASHAPNGTTVTFTIDSALFPGRKGVQNLAAIFKTFFAKGGMQFQPNVVSREMLLDAYEHPEKYPYLLVRVAGYCAYFNHLSDDLKKIIINRTCYS